MVSRRVTLWAAEQAVPAEASVSQGKGVAAAAAAPPVLADAPFCAWLSPCEFCFRDSELPPSESPLQAASAIVIAVSAMLNSLRFHIALSSVDPK